MWLIVAVVVWKYHAWIIFGIACFLWYKVWQHPDLGGRFRVWRRMRQIERQMILRRCDDENAMVLRGDPAGVYGRYTPATLPLTQPRPLVPMYSDTTDWYDYDDGLSDWRTT